MQLQEPSWLRNISKMFYLTRITQLEKQQRRKGNYMRGGERREERKMFQSRAEEQNWVKDRKEKQLQEAEKIYTTEESAQNLLITLSSS